MGLRQTQTRLKLRLHIQFQMADIIDERQPVAADASEFEVFEFEECVPKAMLKKPTHTISKELELAYGHRHFRSIKPITNKILATRWENKKALKHRHQIRTMKPDIDNAPPPRYAHLEQGPKKLQQDAGI